MKTFTSKLFGEVTAKSIDCMGRAELRDLYNEMTGKTIKSFASVAKGVEACNKTLAAMTPPKKESRIGASGRVVKATGGAVAKAGASGKRGPTPIHDKNHIVKILVDENPCRPTSKVYQRFKGYRDGCTVAEALASGLSRGDMLYHERHGWIAVKEA